MSLPTCNVLCTVYDDTGAPVQGATISARLNQFEVYQGYVVPQQVDGTTNASGQATLALWPTQLGSTSSMYVVKILTPNGKRLTINAVVPNVATANLHEIAELPAYEGKTDGQLMLDAAVAAGATSASNATAAANSATDAAASAAAAAASATSASGSATTANTKAAESAGSASASAGSATSAAGSASTATTKAGEASTSATNAASSASTATTKASEASTSATNAASSASTASTAAGTATTKASDAAASATAAAGSAATASTKASDASTSATTAATQASNAATSATNAAASATGAASSASTATTKASDAAGSATTATTKASDSATSATAAAGSATAAANSATASAASATAAAGSASTATTKASDATTSATAAATAKAGAEAARDSALAAFANFSDQYLGTKSADPTTDNTGGSLAAGNLYFNTNAMGAGGGMKVYDGTAWVAAYASLAGALLVANNLSDIGNAVSARTNLGLGNVENKSSATIRGEITSGNVTTALGFTPITNFTSLESIIAPTGNYFPYVTPGTTGWGGAMLVSDLASKSYVNSLGYLTTSSASTTYQTQAGMSSYLTTSSASSTYQTQAAMSAYLTSASATSTYAPLTGTGASGTWSIGISGNAATATKLATPRSINGTNFDGSANINTITYTSTTASNAAYHIPFYSNAAALNQQTYLDTGGDITYNPSTNVLTVGAGNSTNWNTAYGWGNHASAGYLTGITSGQVTTALGFTPMPNFTTLEALLTPSGSYIPYMTPNVPGSWGGAVLLTDMATKSYVTGLGYLTSASAASTYAPLASPTFTGAIKGDFTNATPSSRVMFQTSTSNTWTSVGAKPNGTGTASYFQAYNNVDVDNAAYLYFGITASTATISTAKLGTGTTVPLTLNVGNVEAVRIDTSQNVSIGTSTATGRLTVNLPSGSYGSSSPFFSSKYNDTQHFRVFMDAGWSTHFEAIQVGAYASALAFDVNGTERARIDSSGNFILGTAGAKFQGDFSSAVGSRNAFQTSVAGGSTGILALPSSTGNTASWQAYNGADPANAAFVTMLINASQALITTGAFGTGTALPLAVSVGGAVRMGITTNGGVSFGATGTAYGTSGQVLTSNGDAPPTWASMSSSTFTAVKTSAYTAANNDDIPCNTSGGSFTVTLPATPTAGNMVTVRDYAQTFDTYPLTVARNGANIEGSATNWTCDLKGDSRTFVYIDATKGWLVA